MCYSKLSLLLLNSPSHDVVSFTRCSKKRCKSTFSFLYIQRIILYLIGQGLNWQLIECFGIRKLVLLLFYKAKLCLCINIVTWRWCEYTYIIKEGLILKLVLPCIYEVSLEIVFYSKSMSILISSGIISPEMFSSSKKSRLLLSSFS